MVPTTPAIPSQPLTTITVPTCSSYTETGTFTPSDCAEVSTCTVIVITSGSAFTESTATPTGSQTELTHTEGTSTEAQNTSGNNLTGSQVTQTGSQVTETEVTHTTVTITSCLQKKCETHTSEGIISVITTTIGSQETIYTTICPLPSQSVPGSPGQESNAVPSPDVSSVPPSGTSGFETTVTASGSVPSIALSSSSGVSVPATFEGAGIKNTFSFSLMAIAAAYLL